MATIGTLERVSAASLSQIILGAQDAATAGDPTIAIIDVRDDDHIGGHIKGSQNVPSRTLEAMLPTLVRQLQDKETVVFHCALSQQRGPAAALRYIRERERLLAANKAAADREQSTTAGDGAEEDGAAPAAGEETPAKEQKVVVLDRGFVGWQEVHGTDERLTEGYRKELWEDGYWG
ncbi:arsenate reductase 2.1 [Chaetomidium leptoderma]|uniref:Arsenate reductase 2.1 n=1 Tax=Chaetomidium leptoderma TaxID=669021 RepID=A0AAN6VGM9_9PEZI|nr:arsenate reductase 2.1 [Chaetomidium leptoderma]